LQLLTVYGVDLAAVDMKVAHGPARLPVRTDVTRRRSDPRVQNVQVHLQHSLSSSVKTRTAIECTMRHCSEQAAGERRNVDAAAASQIVAGAWVRPKRTDPPAHHFAHCSSTSPTQQAARYQTRAVR